MRTGLPSKSIEAMADIGVDAVGLRVTQNHEPPPAAERVEPPFPLGAGRVLAQEHAAEVLLGIGRLVAAHLATEQELGERTRPAVRTRDPQAHASPPYRGGP